MGKPVALVASAEDRETRGFISMTTMRPVCGWTANWMFEPPVSTPTRRMMSIEASRMAWYSLSVRVWAGATVMESPVCTPIGSKFSMEQMMTTLSLRSRITSSSNSFQPMTASSMSTSVTMLASRPVGHGADELLRVVGDAAAGAAQGEAGPDDDGEAQLGRHAARVLQGAHGPLRGTSTPISCSAERNRSRSSAQRMAS